MIRKPSPRQMREPRSIEVARNVAETSGKIVNGGVRLGRKTGAFAGAGCLGLWSFGILMSALSVLARYSEHIFTLRGLFATLLILAIPAALIALTVWVVKRAIAI